MAKTVGFKLNGKSVTAEAGEDQKLLWVLRTDFGLTGTKYGCGESYCGACTVIIDKEPVRSCQYPLSDVEGSEVITIEGLEKDGGLHPLQQAFLDHDALQCGYCTPGMIMNAYGLLLRNPHPTREQISEAMEDNLCRCGAHVRIIEAVHEAAGKME